MYRSLLGAVGPGFALALSLACVAIGDAQDGVGAARTEAQDSVALARAARRVLAANCYACHGPDAASREAELRLDTEAGLRTPTLDGAVVTAGDPSASTLWLRVTDGTDPMPPADHGEPLAAEDVEVLERWIASGGDFVEHWSFTPVVRPSAPKLADASWARDPLDLFVIDALRERDLEPSPEADRATWLRRASLDLVGLPPSPERVAAFVADERADAFERAVDELLADPGFGERWASVWLDLARYADTCGYGMDLPRTIWPWRDWVVEALNADMPFDRFTLLQLAGDLVADADDSTRLATAFHRNTLNNTEGGTDDEEFRQLAVKDRVDTTLGVWNGLTAGCARCHDHKFDPLSQREYYALFDLFNQTADRDTDDDAPTLPTPWGEEVERLMEAKRRLAASESRLDDRLDAFLSAAAEEVGGVESEGGLGGVSIEEASHSRGLEQLVGALEASAATLPTSATWTAFVPHAVERVLDAPWTIEDAAVVGEPVERGIDLWRVTYELAEQSVDLADIGAFGVRAARAGRFDAGERARAFAALEGTGLDTRVSLTAHGVPTPTTPVVEVRVVAPGANRLLGLGEVEVFAEGVDVAPHGRARQSSTTDGHGAELAIDGALRGADGDAVGTRASTTFEQSPSWTLTLAEPVAVERIVIHSDFGASFGERGQDLVVSLLDADGGVVRSISIREIDGARVAVEPSGSIRLPIERTRLDGSADGLVGRRAIGTFVPAWLPRTASQLEFALPFARVEHPLLGAFELSVSRGPSRAAEVVATLDEGLRAELEALEVDPLALRERLAEVFAPLDEALAGALEERDEARDARDRMDVTRTPVMVARPSGERRDSFVHERGDWRAQGEQVHAGVPDRFAFAGEPEPTDRLALARWLTDPRHPLTARVTVNRFWARLFGRGIVFTEEDFGLQGTPPTHPRLLDLLAADFVADGWDVKALLRRLVLSSTYRQASPTDERRARLDPDNRWLSRGPRKRLEAEMVRDAALAVSGLLDRTRGGPPVFPPQPDGMWQVAFYGGHGWETSTGGDRYRRDLYTYLRRTQPYHTRTTFDGTSREVCTHRRVATNTPLQALITLNDPVFVEAAQALARRVLAECEDGEDGVRGEESVRGDDTARLGRALELVLSRPADPRRIEVLATLLDRARTDLAARPDDARLFATEPLGPLPEGADPVECAAFTLVANVLLNQDAFLTIE